MVESSRVLSRREFLRGAALAAVGVAAIACQPQTVIVEKEKEVTRVVKETVKETVVVAGTAQVVEKEVTKVVKETVVVEATPVPEPTLKPGELKEVPRNRTLIIMNGGKPYTVYDNQNPYIPGQDAGFHMGTLPACCEPLIMFNVLTGEAENWLAEEWEYNDDFTEITMALRKGVEWNDGTPFTANDVAFTFNLCRDNAASMVHLADLPEFLEEAQVVDDHTVKFVLKKANPAFWATTLTTNHGIHVLPEHIWADQDPMTFTNHDIEKGWPVFTGPYRMVAASPEQKVYDLRDDWWAVEQGFKRKPKVERIIYLPQEEESKAALAIITNQIDMSPIVTVPTLKSIFAQNPKVISFTGHDPPYGYLDWCPIEMNVNCSTPPYDDKDIRWALSYAIDREKLVELAEGGAGVVAYHQFTPYKWFEPFDEALQPLYDQYQYDSAAHPDKVDEIMTGKGYSKDEEGFWVGPDGNRFEMNIHVPGWLRSYGPPLATQLRDAGFDATFDLSPGLGDLTQTGEHTPSFNCKGPSGVLGMDPYFMLAIYTSQYFRPTGEPAPIWWALSRWQNEEYDALVEQIAPLQADDPKAMELFVEAMEIWLSEMPDVYVAQLIIRYPMNTTYWVGWPSSAAPYGFPHSWQWELLKTFINLEPTQ
jgi:peptide/nickel transport system substrate-binding protein